MNLFNRKKKKAAPSRLAKWVDLDGKPLQIGDRVEALRYGLGKSEIVEGEEGFAYQSLENGKVVSCWYMVDAATTHQKVRKIEP